MTNNPIDMRIGVTPIEHEVFDEIARAVEKFPTWPTDPLHALAVLGEEFGELQKAVLQSVYEPHKATPADVAEEAVQVAAMAFRFLASLDVYQYVPSTQHGQGDQPENGADVRPTHYVMDSGSAPLPQAAGMGPRNDRRGSKKGMRHE